MSLFFAKTPKKTRNYEETGFSSAKTAYSLRNSPIYSEKCKIYNENRQFPNIYPDIYMVSRQKADFLPKNANFHHEINEDYREKLRKILENDHRIEEIKEKLAYQPDFITKDLFLLIKGEEIAISFEKLKDFYHKTLECEFSEEKLAFFFDFYNKKSMNFTDFNDFITPLDENYQRFFEEKRGFFNEKERIFENIYVLSTRKLIKSLFVQIIENEFENNRILKAFLHETPLEFQFQFEISKRQHILMKKRCEIHENFLSFFSLFLK